jgi:hypothetical protein
LNQSEELLEPFDRAIKRVEGNAYTRSHGAPWKVIAIMDFLFPKLAKRSNGVNARPDIFSNHWRLLVLDGHGSHCTLTFVKWCRSNRILVAVFPPHSTHRLPPLNISLFGPLTTYYSQSQDAHSRLPQGLASVTKRDFFKNFYSAFDNAFTEVNMRSGWLKAGIEPFNPDQVLKIFDERGGDHPGALGAESVPSRHSSSCSDTPSAQRTTRRIVKEAVAERDAKTEKVIKKLGD